ncbi:MAG: Na/Pi cotransporter family protein [Bacteroidota bacterium]
MKFNLLDFLTLFGSLGFFIYGMKIMSESIQRVAGSRMREILSSMTSNRFKGVLTGFLITSIVQSSSATTVLVVSFVNAGLLSLIESIGVIMGANIGTTVTAWLISIIGFKVKISAYALPIIAIGFPLIFFNRERLKSWGEVLIGFALLFLGLEFLKDAVPDLKSNPEILSFLSSYTDLGFLSTIIFVIIGTLITVVVQSSSASMALTLVMANNGWIPFELAAAMVLGENIGTTITANLAALVANYHAKRAAFAHFIFNVFGVVWIILLLHPVLLLISSVMTSMGNADPFTNPESIPISLSIFHSAFNVTNTLILVWFCPFIAAVTTRIIKAQEDEEIGLQYINVGMLSTAELSIEQAKKETVRFGELLIEMSNLFKKLLEATKAKKQRKLLKKIQKYEVLTDTLEDDISSYLFQISVDKSLSIDGSDKVATLLSTTNELERIGDIFYQMSKDIDAKMEKGLAFSDKQFENLYKMMEYVDDALTVMVENINGFPNQGNYEIALKIEEKINKFRDKLRKDQIKGSGKKSNKITEALYKDIYHLCEKIGDHIISISNDIVAKKDLDSVIEKDIPGDE